MLPLFFLLLAIIAPSLEAKITLPPQVNVETLEVGPSLKFYLRIEDGDYICVIHRKYFSRSYELVDGTGYLQSVAILDPDPDAPRFNVLDEEGGALGAIQEMPYTFIPTFHFLCPHGDTLLIAESNFWQTEFSLIDPFSGTPIGELTRPFIRLDDGWTLDLPNPDLFPLDHRVLASFLAIRSDPQLSEMKTPPDQN
jgi:hypothetical protein